MVHTAQSQSHVKPQAPNSSAAQYGGGFGQPNAQKLLAQGDVSQFCQTLNYDESIERHFIEARAEKKPQS